MNPEILLFLSALAAPYLGRWIAQRLKRGRPIPLHGRISLSLLAVSAAFWIALAWQVTLPVPGNPWNASVFATVVALGAAWTEVALLLGRAASRTSTLDPAKLEQRPDRPEPEEEPDPASEPLPPEAMALLERMSKLDSVTLDQVMTPREAIVSVDANATVGEALRAMRRGDVTRVLIIEGTVDRMLGVAHAKDLAPLAAAGEDARPVRGSLRRAIRLPRHLPASRLIEEFRRDRVTVGVVSDVRGSTLGVVTLGDVLHYLSGALKEQREPAHAGSGESA